MPTKRATPSILAWETPWTEKPGGLQSAAAKSLQSCPTLCDPIDSSPPGSPVPGILQARTLERVAISFTNAWKWKVKVKLLSRVRLLATAWTAAYQAPLSMGFSRQEYWSGVPLPSESKFYSSSLKSPGNLFSDWIKSSKKTGRLEKFKETQMYRTVFWIVWERERVGRFGRMALKHV